MVYIFSCLLFWFIVLVYCFGLLFWFIVLVYCFGLLFWFFVGCFLAGY